MKRYRSYLKNGSTAHRKTNPKTRIAWGRAFTGLAVVVFLAGALPRLDAQTDPGIFGFDRSRYQQYFERADRELTPEAWMKEARQGLEQARSAWERAVLMLSGDRELIAQAGKELDAWSEEELEWRFAQWLIKRFFGSGWEELANSAAAALGRQSNALTFHLDDEGKPLRDSETGDPLSIRPYEEGRDLETDRALFREGAGETARAVLAQYRERLSAVCPELLLYVAPENRERFGAELARLAEESSSLRETEINALIARNERLMVARRSGDVWSLRKQNEEISAEALLNRLIEETSASCSAGIDTLRAKLDAAEGGAGDLSLVGEEWLAAYREQFERGLAAWEAAEERFFVRRMEWETEAETQYFQGEEAWTLAWQSLEREQRNWETNAKTLFESGEALFRNASLKLGQAIAEAKKEFEADALMRINAGSDKAVAWIDTYLSCAQIMLAAAGNAEFWLERAGASDIDRRDIGSEKFEANLLGILDNSLNLTRTQYEVQHQLQKNFDLSSLYPDRKTGTF
ncbi:MAG: hypothetical protein LBH73_06620, partial [Spirochaetaceae bacterium]|nr:hypothetical protein [Spirochaetaceae bacterium]